MFSSAALHPRMLPFDRFLRVMCALACFFCASTLGAQTPPPAPAAAPLTLEGAFARALGANPTIAAARLRRDIPLPGVSLAGEYLNPEARVEFERETPKRSYSLAVPLELGGKRGRRIAVAEATLRTGEAEVTHTIIEIRSQVRKAYFSQVIGDARLTVWEEMQQFATRARDAAQQRFDVGSAPRLEVLQAQLALAQAENQATLARATAQAAKVQLNALLAFPLDGRITLATRPRLPRIPGEQARSSGCSPPRRIRATFSFV